MGCHFWIYKYIGNIDSRASLIAQLVKNLPEMQETRFNSWVGKICWRRDRLPTPVFLGFPCGSAGKESACNVGDLGSIPGLGRSPGEGTGNPVQCSCLENPMDRGAWQATVLRVTKSWTRLSDFHSLTKLCSLDVGRRGVCSEPALELS